MVAFRTMQIVWISCPVVSHLQSTIDNLMNRCNSGCFLFIYKHSMIHAQQIKQYKLKRGEIETEQSRSQEIAHWLNWWKNRRSSESKSNSVNHSANGIFGQIWETHYRKSACKSKFDTKQMLASAKSFISFAHERFILITSSVGAREKTTENGIDKT